MRLNLPILDELLGCENLLIAGMGRRVEAAGWPRPGVSIASEALTREQREREGLLDWALVRAESALVSLNREDHWEEMRRAMVAVDDEVDQAALRPVHLYADCLPPNLVDLFFASGWCRPELYLEPEVRAGISCFALGDSEDAGAGLERLRGPYELGMGAQVRGRDSWSEGVRRGLPVPGTATANGRSVTARPRTGTAQPP